MLHSLINSLFSFFSTIDYTAIFILMTLESSIFPVPSELVMIPAGVSAMGGNINPIIATIVGGIGSVVGALLNYYILGRYLGKPFLEKYGKYILITEEKYKRAEDLFLQNDKIYTFIGRFIPVVRHLISIPAGIFRMRIIPFVSITFIGATLWCAILVALGYFLGDSVTRFISQYSNEVGYISVVLIGIYIWYKIFRKKSIKKTSKHNMNILMLGKYNIDILAKEILQSLIIAGEHAIKNQEGVVNIGKEGESIDGDTEEVILRRNAKTKIDEEVQEILLKKLIQIIDPKDFILDAEEITLSCSSFSNQNSQATIIIDPIDGTLEYIDGSTDYSICLAILISGKFSLIYVYYPANGILYAKVGDDIFIQNMKTNIKTQLQSPNTQKKVVYANNRVTQEILLPYINDGYTIVQSQEIYGWDDALVGYIRGEFTHCFFHTPQMRDILIGFIGASLPGGKYVDFSGKAPCLPEKGRISEVHFYFG